VTNFRAGLAVVLAFVAVVWFAFARPDRSPGSFEVRAVFSSVTGLRPGLSPVRIAGVEVGRVTAVQSFQGTRRAIVTMRLHDDGLPLHVDATMKLRPRLFLEGNSFVDLQPGSPTAAVMRSGFEVPMRQTAVAVTFPHVLGALDADTRLSLQRTIQAWGQALTTADTGASLNSALHNAAIVMPRSAVLSDASTGRAGERPVPLAPAASSLKSSSSRRSKTADQAHHNLHLRHRRARGRRRVGRPCSGSRA